MNIGISSFILLIAIGVIEAWVLQLTPNQDRLQNRRTGDNFLVICKVKDFDGAASDVKIEWHKDDKVIPQFGSTMTIERTYSNQLMINRPKTSDGGKYTCTADIYGQTQTITADINFVDPPKFINPKENQHPEEGTTAKIICQVEGTDELEVFWQYNGVTLDESSQRGYEFSEDRQTLLIPNYNAKRDDGIYNCNAAQYSSFETLSINVTGYARPMITVFDVPSGNRGMEGSTIELKCGAIGKPKPEYKWYFEGKEMEMSFSDKHKGEDGLLIIESLNTDDEGAYKCIASNDVGNDEKEFQLDVFLKPKVEVSAHIVKEEGETAEIECTYEGEGNIIAKFVHGTQEFMVKNGYTDDETVENSPENNKEGSEEDNVSEEKSIEKQEELLDNISADVEEKIEKINWKRFVSDINNERVSIHSQDDNKIILTVKKLSLEDAGEYKCVASNEAGDTEKISKIEIIHPPTLRHYTGPSIRSFNGNTVELFCDVSAVPAPKWKWMKDGYEVEANGASVQIHTVDRYTKLTLQNNDDNYGIYSCKADNGYGVLEKNIEVIEVVKPSAPTGMDCKKLIYPNYGKCSFDENTFKNEQSKPVKVEFLVSKLEDMKSDFDWNDAQSITANFENEVTIPGLSASTQYVVKARFTNEAGTSDFSEEQSLETTDPWVPESPKSLRMECSDSCIVSWSPPNDHGSPIKNYRVNIQELERKSESKEEEEENEEDKEGASDETIQLDSMEHHKESTESYETEHEKSTDDSTPVPVGSPLIIEVGADETEIQLTHIKQHSFYRISVLALNSVGQGEPISIDYLTDENPTKFGEEIEASTLILATAIGLFFILLVIDFICFLTNRCGVIACLCINYCGRGNPSRDLEAGKVPERNLLLDNGGTR